MIQLLEARNFRMLRSNAVALRPFQVLVGQNASGKSTFLGALQLIGDVLTGGARFAVERWTPNFYDLCFDRSQPISLAVELEIPGRSEDAFRYEIEVGIDVHEGLQILRENLYILQRKKSAGPPASLYGSAGLGPLIHDDPPAGWRRVAGKTPEGRDFYRDERSDWNESFRFGADRSALGSLPDDPERFPRSMVVRDVLRDGIRTLVLDAAEMRRPSPPGEAPKLAPNGANLPHVVRTFKKRDPVLYGQWVRHVGLAVEGLRTVDVREREEDRFLVLETRFEGRHTEPVPSWMLSDGTLRLMALTLLSYAATENDWNVYLVEEPENGLHPLAIQAVYEALSRPASQTQVLCATHSPIFLAHAALEETLVFRRAKDGTAIVRRGSEIPDLQDWSGRVNLPDLFVTGVLA